MEEDVSRWLRIFVFELFELQSAFVVSCDFNQGAFQETKVKMDETILCIVRCI
jgi:hypothetical protein